MQATVGHGPEYETLGGFGGLLLNGDLNSIAHINYLCNDYGLDTISHLAVIACAVEAFDRSLLLTLADTDGLRLTWANGAGDRRLSTPLATNRLRRPPGRRGAAPGRGAGRTRS